MNLALYTIVKDHNSNHRTLSLKGVSVDQYRAGLQKRVDLLNKTTAMASRLPDETESSKKTIIIYL